MSNANGTDIRTTQDKKMDVIDEVEADETAIRFRVDSFDTFRYAFKIPENVLHDHWGVFYTETGESHLLDEDALRERLRCCDETQLIDFEAIPDE